MSPPVEDSAPARLSPRAFSLVPTSAAFATSSCTVPPKLSCGEDLALAAGSEVAGKAPQGGQALGRDRDAESGQLARQHPQIDEIMDARIGEGDADPLGPAEG